MSLEGNIYFANPVKVIKITIFNDEREICIDQIMNIRVELPTVLDNCEVWII